MRFNELCSWTSSGGQRSIGSSHRRCNRSLLSVRSCVISNLVLLSVCIYSVVSETQWVWSQNRQGQVSGSGNSNFGQNNLQFPESPQRPSSISTNDALPPGAIRIINSQGEARLIPGAAQFVSNAINNLVDRAPGGGSAGGQGGGSGVGGGLLSIGSGFLSSLPQIAQSALGLLFNRNPSTSGSNNNNGGSSNIDSGSSSPGIPSFPSSPSSGGGGSGIPIISPGSTGGGGGGGGNCRCVPLNQCFLPSRPNGDCSGGNSNCCLTSSSTRAISADDLLLNGQGGTRTLTRTDVRVGLLENIVRGSSSVFDDALDLVLQPWLTQEDQQKLANRIANNNGR